MFDSTASLNGLSAASPVYGNRIGQFFESDNKPTKLFASNQRPPRAKQAVPRLSNEYGLPDMSHDHKALSPVIEKTRRSKLPTGKKS